MFNALNRFISRLDSDTPPQTTNQGGFGFQVLQNKSTELAIEPWFDFIVGINGRMIVRKILGLSESSLTGSRMIQTRPYLLKKFGIAPEVQ